MTGCPSCGTGWIGTPEHVAQAWASWRAYEREMAVESGCCPTCLAPSEAQPGRVSDMDNGVVSQPCPTCTR